MNARKTAAVFAASAWYEECRAGRQTQQETAKFARRHWTLFLPVAHEGLGRLLKRIAARTPNIKSARPGTSALAEAV